MKNKKIYIMLVVSILLTVIGVSLAYFSLNIIGNDTAKYNTITTGNLSLTYNDTSELSFDNALPGDSITKTITVKNTGTEEVSYNLVWQELTNTITNNELVIEGTCKNLNSSNTEDGKCSAISKKAVKEGNVTSNITIKPGYTQEYEVKITFIDTGRLQNYNKNKSFKGKLGLTESSAKTIYCTFDGELTQGVEYVNGQYTYRYKQKGVLAEEGLEWGNIKNDGWGVQLTDKINTKTVNSSLCTYINGKPIIAMSYMYGAEHSNTILETINLKSFNTSNVIDMNHMFYYNSNVSSLDLSGFNTSNVTDMAGMFAHISVISLNLSDFDTSNVIDMSGMFNNGKFNILDLSEFNTEKLESIAYMFMGNADLKTIYVSDKFVIDNVRLHTGTFRDCTNLVGGSGTTYDSSKVDKTYAHIDGGTSNPGYFTDIADKPKEPESFATDSWPTIAKAVRDNNISKYNIGDTKTIDMGIYGTHTVRIANTSTPNECSTSGFSQTACGFVLEFADIITTHNMNDTATNVGGWPASSMHTFVNTNIYDSLPYNLKSNIIDTIVVSGHGSDDSNNFTSIDKLYLLTLKEIYSDYTDSSDTINDLTRTLDYYIGQGVTTSNYTEVKKKKETSVYSWWLRAANSNYANSFHFINANGFHLKATAKQVYGVSPAFRIG